MSTVPHREGEKGEREREREGGREGLRENTFNAKTSINYITIRNVHNLNCCVLFNR